MNTKPLDPSHRCPERCRASADINTGVSDGAYYNTLNAFENYDSLRSSRFPNTCTLEEITGTRRASFNVRYSAPRYPYLYNVTTRRRDEIFAYGGLVGQGLGSYVAKLNAASLEETWRVPIQIPDHWPYPGVAAVLGDGCVYAVAGNRLVKIDADTGENTHTNLPENAGNGGASYNGFVVSPDRVIFAKGMEHGSPCQQTGLMQNLGLGCAVYHNIPSFLVAVDTKTGPNKAPEIIAQIRTEEFILGRITSERRDGVDFIYCPGVTKLWRYRFQRKGNQCVFERDSDWEIPYVGAGNPGTAVAILNDWAIIANNGFESFSQPFTLWAANIHDARKSHSITPLEGYPVSQIGSKPAVDPENNRVFISDFHAGIALGIDFDPEAGFKVRWQEPQAMLSFWTAVGPPDRRQIVGTDYVSSTSKSPASQQGDHAVWRDASTGAELGRTPVLNSIYNAQSINPGFDGKFYYVPIKADSLVEISPVASR